MALKIIATNSIGPGVRMDLGTTDDGFVVGGVTVASTDNVSIFGTGSGHTVNIQGTVNGLGRAVALGDDNAADHDQHLIVGNNAYVSDFDGTGVVRIMGYDSRVDNRGLISGAIAINISGDHAGTQSTIVNDGSIIGTGDGIYHSQGSTEALLVENTGLIKSDHWAFEADDTANAAETILNSGQMIGTIAFKGGDDTYDGQTGHLTGIVLGGEGTDTLLGGVDNDTFRGDEGADTLSGGLGDDDLWGGTGNDTMSGGGGADTYRVDDAGDIVDETGGSGVDTVIASVSFSLADGAHARGGLEKLTLTGNAANGTGNALANTIIGSFIGNVLDGLAGNDVLNGTLGDDTLRGGAGRDVLTGGDDSDKFVFNSPLIAANRDLITDFGHGIDKIQLENAIFKGIGVNGGLKSTFFFDGAHAHDANDHIIYNHATGALFYDSDGTGANVQVQFATLANHALLTASDFQVI